MKPVSEADWAGQSVGLLKEMHLLTRDGQLNADARRKLKQVQHLFQILREPLEELRQAGPLRLVDLGAGKSYLGFILYDLWARHHEGVEIVGVEARAELVERCRQIAAREKLDRIAFLAAHINAAEVAGPVQAVTALHACDTATDDAIEFALAKEAPLVALVGCCQAEVARSLDDVALAKSASYPLWRAPLSRRTFGSHLTNVIRALYLEAHGYKVRVTEFTGWEHSLKNELILARKIQPNNALALGQLRALLAELPVKMQLLQTPTAQKLLAA